MTKNSSSHGNTQAANLYYRKAESKNTKRYNRMLYSFEVFSKKWKGSFIVDILGSPTVYLEINGIRQKLYGEGDTCGLFHRSRADIGPYQPGMQG